MKGNKYFLDTNIFLRLLAKDNPKLSQECGKVIAMVQEGKIKAFTSSLVFVEVFWALKSFYDLDKKDLVRILKSITKISNLKLNNAGKIDLAIDLYEKYNVKFIDAIIASNPRIIKKEMIVVSYDHDFDKIGVRRQDPKSLIYAENKNRP